MANLKSYLQGLSENYRPHGLYKIKIMLDKAAMSGKRRIVLGEEFLNEDVIKWLKDEGLKVDYGFDQRDGDFIVVTW